MGNLFGIKSAVGGMSRATQDALAHISREVTETRTILTKITNTALQRIDEELIHMREFLTNKAWPEVDRTMTQFRGVLDQASEFLVTGSFAVKVLALLFALCAAYMIHKMISERKRWQSGKKVSSCATIVNAFLNIMLWLCFGLSFLLVVQLLKAQLNTMWPHFSENLVSLGSNTITKLVACFHHYVKLWSCSVPLNTKNVIAVLALVAVTCIFLNPLATLKTVFYWVIEYPFARGLDPVIIGSGYMTTLPLKTLQIISCIVLYPPVLYAACSFIQFFQQSEESILKFWLSTYVVVYGSALLISAVYRCAFSPVIRCFWAIWAKSNLERKKQ